MIRSNARSTQPFICEALEDRRHLSVAPFFRAPLESKSSFQDVLHASKRKHPTKATWIGTFVGTGSGRTNFGDDFENVSLSISKLTLKALFRHGGKIVGSITTDQGTLPFSTSQVLKTANNEIGFSYSPGPSSVPYIVCTLDLNGSQITGTVGGYFQNFFNLSVTLNR